MSVKLSRLRNTTMQRKEERNIDLIMLGPAPPSPITIFKNTYIPEIAKLNREIPVVSVSCCSACPVTSHSCGFCLKVIHKSDILKDMNL